MNIQQLRRIIRQESPSHLSDGVVVSVDSRGARTASVRVSGGHVHSRVYICDETLEIGDRVVIARLEGLARQVVIGKIVSQHGSSLSNQGVLAPPNNFTALSFAGVAYCQWDTYPGEDLSWEVQYSLNGSPYGDAAQVLVSRGSYYFYSCDPGTTVYFRARGIRWLGDNNLMYSAWTSWTNVTCSEYEVPRLLMKLTNQAGKQVEEGWVVVIDTGNASSFKTTVTADDEDVIGVAFETIADGALGLVCISGLVDVYASDAPAIGDYLISSVTEGNATGSASTSKGCFGRALTTKSGNTVTAIIDPPLGAGAGVLGHNLLSAEHPDTLADAVARGDILVGNATPEFARLVAKTDKQILVGDGTDIASVAVSQDVALANTGAMTVEGIQARAVAPGAPADGQVYAWNAGASEWQPVAQSGGGGGGGGNPVFKSDGALVIHANIDGAYVMPSAATIAAVYLHCGTTGTISDTVVDVNKNGVTIFTNQANRPALLWNDADHVAKSGVPDIVSLAENDVLTADICAIATGAQDLTVVVALATGGAGEITLEVQEDDVKVADVTVLNFEGGGGLVVDEGGGKATVDISGGGGGGAPTAAKYVVTEAHGDLSAEIVLPQLGYYNPDTPPAAPGAYDDEFDNDAIAAAWVFSGAYDAAFDLKQSSGALRASESVYHGYLLLQGDHTVTRTFTPTFGDAWTLVTKLSIAYDSDLNESWWRFQVKEDATHYYSVRVGRKTGGMQVRTVYDNGGGAAEGDLIGIGYGTEIYVMVTKDTGTNFSCFVSTDGKSWMPVERNRNLNTWTSVAEFSYHWWGLGETDGFLAIEFLRYFTTEAQYKIGKDV